MKQLKNKQPPISTITPAQLNRLRKNVNKCWVKLDRKQMPPSGMKVIVRCQLGKDVRSYVGEFRYGEDKIADVKLNSCHYPIPMQCWKTEGLTHWIPIPD